MIIKKVLMQKRFFLTRTIVQVGSGYINQVSANGVEMLDITLPAARGAMVSLRAGLDVYGRQRRTGNHKRGFQICVA